MSLTVSDITVNADPAETETAVVDFTAGWGYDRERADYTD